MILLALTTDKLQVVTGSAATVDVHVSYVDMIGVSITPGRQNTAISSATTTDVLAAPATSTYRNAKSITVRNRHASLSCDVTVLYNANGSTFELYKATLRPNESIEYADEYGFRTQTNGYILATTYSTSDQAIGASTTAYLTGSDQRIATTTRPIAVGTQFEWAIALSKTAAATAGFTFDVRFGTNGTTADTSRLAFTTGTQTAAADQGFVLIRATVRGPIGASCVVVGQLFLGHNLAATGLINIASNTLNTTSAAFDITTAAMIVGVSLTTGATHAVTIQQVRGRTLNI